jgi:hypothetical protein
MKKLPIVPIDVIGSANAIQCYVALIQRKVKDPEIIELGYDVLKRLDRLQEEVRSVFFDET